VLVGACFRFVDKTCRSGCYSQRTLRDKNFDTEDFVMELREINVTPHVAQNIRMIQKPHFIQSFTENGYAGAAGAGHAVPVPSTPNQETLDL
jgi:hypothetical protein